MSMSAFNDKEVMQGELRDHVLAFAKKQRITCKEQVYQEDRVILNALKFIDGCMEIVGAYRELGEDE